MGYCVEVVGSPTQAVQHLLEGVVGEDAVHVTPETTIVSVLDQSALLAVLARLHDLGLTIRAVQRN